MSDDHYSDQQVLEAARAAITMLGSLEASKQGVSGNFRFQAREDHIKAAAEMLLHFRRWGRVWDEHRKCSEVSWDQLRRVLPLTGAKDLGTDPPRPDHSAG